MFLGAVAFASAAGHATADVAVHRETYRVAGEGQAAIDISDAELPEGWSLSVQDGAMANPMHYRVVHGYLELSVDAAGATSVSSGELILRGTPAVLANADGASLSVAGLTMSSLGDGWSLDGDEWDARTVFVVLPGSLRLTRIADDRIELEAGVALAPAVVEAFGGRAEGASLLRGSLLISVPVDITSRQATNDGAGDTTPPTGEAEGVIGPDVTVSRVGLDGSSSNDDFWYYGTSGGIRAFSLASTSCNIGDRAAEWVSGPAGNHPVIGQNMYRLLNGRFEHIGQSWLKHGFCAVSEFTCGPCQSTNCGTLGINCADTYWATLNDGSNGGPKSRINPQGLGNGGTHNNHSFPAPTGPGAIVGRLQITDADINAGGQHFAEIQYITHDESLELRHNNASWREVNMTLTSISGVAAGQGSVQWQEPGILAWATNEPGVTILNVDVPGEGRFHLGFNATSLGGGMWHYEYALHNMNSDRSGQSFSVPIDPAVTISNVGFHDVDYHSGEPYSLTDWTPTQGGGAITWATETEAQNPNANALRWGTLYNFRFDADAPPAAVDATIGLFKAGSPDSLVLTVDGPSPVTGGIPTVSEWGVVMIALLLAATGTIIFGLRRVRQAEPTQ